MFSNADLLESEFMIVCLCLFFSCDSKPFVQVVKVDTEADVDHCACMKPPLSNTEKCLLEKLQGIVSALLDVLNGNESDAKVPCYMNNINMRC